jgi:hypothetical protein
MRLNKIPKTYQNYALKNSPSLDPMGNCPFVDFKSGWRISNPASGSQIRLADFKSG